MAAPISRTKIYKYHVTNLRSIETALKNTALSARKAISEENEIATRSFTSLYSFLVGAWAENRLKKVLFENNGMANSERDTVLSCTSQIDQWIKAVEVAFRKHYEIPRAIINNSNLPYTAFARYSALNEILNDDLRAIIEIRNKLAHGQWVYPFNSDQTGIEQEKFNYLQKENLPSIQYKFRLISSLSAIIHDLIVSLPTFERDFDKNFKMITNTRLNLENRSYETYKKSLIKKHKRGIEKRKTKKS